jgi:ribosomal protein S18 acetylase RimI-like enzyme
LADLDGNIGGVILSGHDGRRGFIYHTAVQSKNGRQGIGKALVAAVEEAMKKEGIHKIALVVFGSNSRGNNFWEAQGYSLREDLFYRNKSLNPENR